MESRGTDGDLIHFDISNDSMRLESRGIDGDLIHLDISNDSMRLESRGTDGDLIHLDISNDSMRLESRGTDGDCSLPMVLLLKSTYISYWYIIMGPSLLMGLHIKCVSTIKDGL